MSKQAEYTGIILEKIQECINDIGTEELSDPENVISFMHSVTLNVPCMVYNSMTGESKGVLEVNQLANTLFCQSLQNETQKVSGELGKAYGEMSEMYTKKDVINFATQMYEQGEANHDFPLSTDRLKEELKDRFNDFEGENIFD
jgi:hypothetical protein